MRGWVVGIGLSLSLVALADDPLQLAPSDWSKKAGSGLVTWSAPASFETLTYAEMPKKVEIDQAQILARTFLERMGCSQPRQKTAEQLDAFDCEIERDGKTLRMFAIASERRSDGPMVTIHAAPMDDAQALARQALIAPRASALASGQPPADSAPRAVRTVATNAPVGALARVVFDLDYVGGVGGATYPRYEPVYLFAGGLACRCANWAAQDVTSQILNAQPQTRRGQWISDGSVISIQYADGGKPEKVPAKRGVPATVPKTSDLVGRYQSVGGGGNVAFGGGTLMASANTLSFYEDGSFSDSNSGYASGTGGVGGARRVVAGRYRIDRSTLELNYSDGRQVRTSLFYSSKRKVDAEYGQLGVVWIGGKGFKRVE